MTVSETDEAKLTFAFAHDLRSHLRMMHTRVQLVQRSSSSLAEQQNQWLREALAAGDEMNRLIGAMVTYHSVTEVTETMPMNLILRGLRMELKSLLSEAEAELLVSGADSEEQVSRCIATVLRELVSNSCRFRRPNVGVRIIIATGYTAEGDVEILVHDNGLGVAEEYHEDIFEPFRRMHSRSEFPGFGLGLALCRRTMLANRGTITAFHSPEGGLSLRVVLPAFAGNGHSS